MIVSTVREFFCRKYSFRFLFQRFFRAGIVCGKGVSDIFRCGLDINKNGLVRKKIFFCTVKKFPQEFENTREIIKNMSEIF